MKRRIVAGVDCSTQATKVLVVDADTGETLALGRAPHTVTGVHGARETDPDEWYAALGAALAATGLASEIEAISIAGQQHGLVVVDGGGRPLRTAILWNDTRAASQSERLIEELGGPAEAARLVGSVPGPAFTVCSWIWLRENEPEVARAVRGIRLPHDWLIERLTGDGATDRGDASATGWWSPSRSRYLPEVLGLPSVEIDVAMLPRVLGPSERAGRVSPRAAAELGLRAGTIVGPGTGDNPAAALAVGAPPGTPVVSLGTSGTVFTTSTLPSHDASGVVVGLADAAGAFLPLACTLNCTLAVDRFAELFGLDRNAAAGASRGVVVLPFFDGERTPNLPNAAASIAGLRATSTPGEILRAAYEGAAFSLLDAMTAVDAHSSGIDPDAPLILVGGGASGETWRECLAELSGRAIATVRATEHAALGAATQAKAALDGLDVRDAARAWARPADIVLPPRPVRADLLDEIGSAREALRDLNETARPRGS